MQADWARAAAGGFPSAAAYAEAQPQGGSPVPRVFCSWNQTATATGRLSSSAPNLQARRRRGHACCWVADGAPCRAPHPFLGPSSASLSNPPAGVSDFCTLRALALLAATHPLVG